MVRRVVLILLLGMVVISLSLLPVPAKETRECSDTGTFIDVADCAYPPKGTSTTRFGLPFTVIHSYRGMIAENCPEGLLGGPAYDNCAPIDYVLEQETSYVGLAGNLAIWSIVVVGGYLFIHRRKLTRKKK